MVLFLVVIEVLMMEVVFEIFREVGVCFLRVVGFVVFIVGVFVIG